MGWLRLLSEWVGPDGEVVGTDIDDAMLAEAKQFVADGNLGKVTLLKDDLFATRLEPSSFDLVHARYEITPLGRGSEQLTTYTRLVRPGGTVVFFGGLERGAELTVDAYRLHYEELRLVGAFHHTPRTVRAALAFLASGAYPWERLVTHRVDLEGVVGLFADPPRDLLKAAVFP